MIKIITRKFLAQIIDWGMILFGQLLVFLTTDLPIYFHIPMLIIFVSLVTSLSISISNKHTIGDKIVGIELVSINKGSDSLLKWKALYRNIIYITSITLIIISYGNTIEFINYILLTVGIQIYWIPNEVWGKLCLLDFVSKTRYEIVH